MSFASLGLSEALVGAIEAAGYRFWSGCSPMVTRTNPSATARANLACWS